MNTNVHPLKIVIIMTTSVLIPLVLHSIFMGFEVPKHTSLIIIGSMILLILVAINIHARGVAGAEEDAYQAAEDVAEINAAIPGANEEKVKELTQMVPQAEEAAKNLAAKACIAAQQETVLAAVAAGGSVVALPMTLFIHGTKMFDPVITGIAVVIALMSAIVGAMAATKDFSNFWKPFALITSFMSVMAMGCYLIFSENHLGVVIVGMSILLAMTIVCWDYINQKNSQEIPTAVKMEIKEMQSMTRNDTKNDIVDPASCCGTKELIFTIHYPIPLGVLSQRFF